jgi:hypothetical protein
MFTLDLFGTAYHVHPEVDLFGTGYHVQFVEIGDHKSKYLNMPCRVPQGSVLGPKLFDIH